MPKLMVLVGCRPFVKSDDKLGLALQQVSDEPPEATVELLNSRYTTNAYCFNWAWSSAYNWQKKMSKENASDVSLMESVKIWGQPEIYNSVGKNMLKDLLNGDTVVLFAYGLSGSGKTYAVFGPDDPLADEAWFKHEEEHWQWGILPRLMTEIFEKHYVCPVMQALGLGLEKEKMTNQHIPPLEP